VARKPGIVTASSDGQGQAQATLNDGTTLIRNSNVGTIGAFATRAAHAGDYVILWGTGLGPDTASDTGGSSGNMTDAATIRVNVNGTPITPAYAGRSQGYPGLDQIVFILPANVTLSCAVAVQVTEANGVQSNAVTIATAASNTDACTPPSSGGNGGGGGNLGGLSQTDVDRIVNSGSFKFGSLSLIRSTITTPGIGGFTQPTTTKTQIADGTFESITGLDLRNYLQNTSSLPNYTPPADGVCNVFTASQTQTQINPTPNLTITSLDAGANLTLQGPGGTQVLTKSTAGGQIAYEVTINGGLAAGTYTFSGPGGPQVGSFNLSAPLAAEVQWTNMAAVATTTRANGMPITWTGGDPTQLLFITGFSVDTTAGAGAGFICYANQSRGSFTVPASILNQLPASSTTGAGGFQFSIPGSVELISISAPVIGTASGLDILVMESETIVGGAVTFQ
jgi:hypothetical protein